MFSGYVVCHWAVSCHRAVCFRPMFLVYMIGLMCSGNVFVLIGLMFSGNVFCLSYLVYCIFVPRLHGWSLVDAMNFISGDELWRPITFSKYVSGWFKFICLTFTHIRPYLIIYCVSSRQVLYWIINVIVIPYNLYFSFIENFYTLRVILIYYFLI